MDIKPLLEEVEDGTSKRIQCPRCRGENTFSITCKDGVYFYNCFHASCNFSGVQRGIPNLSSLRLRNAPKSHLNGLTEEEAPFQLPAYLVMGISSKKCLQMLIDTHCLEAYQKGYFRLAYDPRQDRLVFLVYHDNEVMGAIGRTLGRGRPKTLVYPHSKPVPLLIGKGRTLVITEDMFSAAAMASHEGFTGSPMLGSNLRDEYLPYYKDYDVLIVAYDPDAKKKGLKLKQYLTYHHSCVKVWNTPKDIKDMSKNEMEDFLHENYRQEI